MSDPVQCVVSYPSPSFAVSVQTAAGFPVTLPTLPTATVENNNAGSVSVEFLNGSPAQVIILPETGPAGRAGSPGPAGNPGSAGAAGSNAQTVVLTLAAYLALDAPTQMNGTWYVIPK